MLFGSGWQSSPAELGQAAQRKVQLHHARTERQHDKKKAEHIQLNKKIDALIKQGKIDEARRLERRRIQLERDMQFLNNALDQSDNTIRMVEVGHMHAQQLENTKAAVVAMASTAVSADPAQVARMHREMERAKDALEFTGEQMEEMFAQEADEKEAIEDDTERRIQARIQLEMMKQPSVPYAIADHYVVPIAHAPIAEMSEPIGGPSIVASPSKPPSAAPAPYDGDAFFRSLEERFKSLNLP